MMNVLNVLNLNDTPTAHDHPIPPATSPPTVPYLPTLFIHDPTLSSLGASLNKIFSSSLRNLRSPLFASLRFGSLAWRSWAQTRLAARVSEHCLILSSCHVTQVTQVWCLVLFYCVILCKRETKRNEAIVWFLVGCVFLCYIHYTFIVIGKVLYSTYTWCLHGTGPANSRNTEKSGVP